MSNYSLVVNSQFQPFTYQELAAPLDRQELYHEKLAQEYDNLSRQADVLEAMGENDRDKNSKSYGQYKAYSDSLRNEADNLYRFGLNTESRQRLSNLRRRYNTEIVPIQNAWTKREEEAKMQLTATMNNPSIMFTRDADKTTLDEYIKNPLGGYGVISGANITAQMAQMAKNLAKQVRGHRKEGIDELTYNYITEHGLDENMIRDWRNYPTLKAMFEQVMKANGVTPEALEGSMNAQSIVDKSTNYAEMGMWDAMGEDKEHFIVDEAKKMAMEEAKQKRVAAYTHALSNPQPVNTDIPAAPGDHNMMTYPDPKSAGAAARNKLANLAADFMEGYFETGKKKGLTGIAERQRNKAIVTYLRNAGDTGIDFNNPAVSKLGRENPQLMKQLRAALKDSFDGNKDLVDMWLDNSIASSSTPNNPKSVTTQSSYIPSGPWADTAPKNGTIGPWGKDAPKGVYSPWSNSSSKKTREPNWSKFDDAAHNGYFMTTTTYNDNQTVLGNKLAGIITNQMQTGSDKIPLYEIKGNNTATGRVIPGDKKLTLSDLPQTKDGNIKWNEVHRQDLGPDWILSWVKDGKAHRAVLRSEDMGLLANQDRTAIVTGQRSAENLYKAGLITYQEYVDMTNRYGNNMGQQGFGMQQEVKVSPYDVTKQWGFDYSNPYYPTTNDEEEEE